MAKDAPPPGGEVLEVTMLMADAAQVADGRLNLLGAGIAVVPPTPQPLALALVVKVPWSRGDETIPWICELLWADGISVMAGEVPVLVNSHVSAGRPVGWHEGKALSVPVIISFNGLPLTPGASYVWRLVIDGATDDRWSLGFSVLQDVRTA